MDHLLYVATTEKLQKYETIRENETYLKFWDIVVITAVDDVQKQAYEIQLKWRLQQKDLPSSPNYVVISDPTGPKIGNGGSTLVVIGELFKQYGEEIWTKKIIIIHAGGYSQRMPSASVIGKAFVALPVGQKVYQAIDVKLATYIDLPSKIISGGLFVCCPDTIEAYYDAGIGWMFPETGFTGLAGLSPLSIAEQHGVYVTGQNHSLIAKCERFLHKPSSSLMHGTKGCVIYNQDGKENALTDSSFFISPPAMKILHNFYNKHSPLSCEIDAYGDFLQALGPKGTSDYIYNVKNVVDETSDLVTTRKLLYDEISNMPLYAVLLAPTTSNAELTLDFSHLGTTKEYLYHLTTNPRLKYILNIATLLECGGNIYQILPTNDNTDRDIIPSIIKSKLSSKVSVYKEVIVEYSYLRSNVTIGNHCIVSNCDIPQSTNIVKNVFMHTATVSMKSSKFVTVLYCITEDTKKSYTEQQLGELVYFGQPLYKRFTIKRILPDDKHAKFSLWNLKLFPLSSSVAEATKKACEALDKISTTKSVELYDGDELYSMHEILQHKDVLGMMKYRKKVEEDIMSQRTKVL